MADVADTAEENGEDADADADGDAEDTEFVEPVCGDAMGKEEENVRGWIWCPLEAREAKRAVEREVEDVDAELGAELEEDGWGGDGEGYLWIEEVGKSERTSGRPKVWSWWWCVRRVVGMEGEEESGE